MRNLYQPLLLVVFVMLFSCSSNEQKKQVIKSPVREKVVANQIMVAEVEGMVCKMGCGASIRKALNDEGGVANCQIDFEEERKINVLKIKYDSTIITQQKMIQLLSSINERQFKVAVQ